MDRRKFIKSAGLVGGAAAATTLAAPAIAQSSKEMVIVSTWPRDFPGLGISAQRLSARIEELTEGKIKTQYFAAGERVGALRVGWVSLKWSIDNMMLVSGVRSSCDTSAANACCFSNIA